MTSLLLLIILLCTILSMIEDYIGKYRKYIYVFIGFILMITAGLREVGFDRDSENYEHYFLHCNDALMGAFVEFSFLWLSRLVQLFSYNVHFVFLLYAILGISTKFYALSKLSKYWFLPVTILLGNYFLLQDMTQIRVSIVTGLILLSIIPLSKGQKKIGFTIILLCCFFHYSSIALFPLLFLNNKELTKKWIYLLYSIVPIGYIICLANINILTDIPIPYISDKVLYYQELHDRAIKGDEINVFNVVFLVKVFIYLYCIYFYETIKYYNKYISIQLKIMGVSIFSYLVLSFLPVIAIRIGELYGIVDILVYTSIVYTIRPLWLSKLTVCSIGIIQFLINIYFIGLFSK